MPTTGSGDEAEAFGMSANPALKREEKMSSLHVSPMEKLASALTQCCDIDVTGCRFINSLISNLH